MIENFDSGFRFFPKSLITVASYSSLLKHFFCLFSFRVAVIFTLHILAFFEYPSSLSLSSDVRLRQERVDVPCWLTSTIELLCLLLLLADNVTRVNVI